MEELQNIKVIYDKFNMPRICTTGSFGVLENVAIIKLFRTLTVVIHFLFAL
jgi:hypothetical protein